MLDKTIAQIKPLGETAAAATRKLLAEMATFAKAGVLDKPE